MLRQKNKLLSNLLLHWTKSQTGYVILALLLMRVKLWECVFRSRKLMSVILVKGEVIHFVDHFKYLGMIMDSNLHFKKH